ncbi:MAG: DUF4281 domain-containing protein [Acidobacteria bacterium]|nr:DUF4281 domain-containing protein [Acidobacteriota bacterium]
MEILFELSSLLVFPFWVLMLFLPGWRLTGRVMRSPWVAAGPALLYALLVLPHLVEHAPVLMRPELGKVAALLGSTEGAAISWAHFLSFDLLVGRWIYLDGRRRGVSAWLMAPVLFLTLLFGPLGFLLHLCLNRVFGRPGQTNSVADPKLTF